MSITVHCNVSKCKKTFGEVLSEYDPGEGWNRITVSVGSMRSKHLHICPECSSNLGIVKAKSVSNPGQELLDIIYDIAMEAVSNSEE